MKAKVTLHFYAKSTKANTTGQFPIYIRLTINGNRLEFSTKKFVDSSKWSADLAKMKGTTEEARSINNLTKSNISIGIDGEKWIFTHRNKTENASKIPI